MLTSFFSRPLAGCILAFCLNTPVFTAATFASTALQIEMAPAILPAPATVDHNFAQWLTQFKQEALEQGISQTTLDAALPNDLQPITRVIELDQRQPEFVDTFWNYLDRRIDEPRVKLGRDKIQEHKKLLQKVQTKYGVSASILVAFWGLETHFGRSTGNFATPAALATLACDNRRSEFFRNELLHALKILEQGHLPAADMKGSWAGAMGQMQFMPSTFLTYAVDADGDGRKDIWQSLPDAFHSAANYLRKAGWHPGEIWGRQVILPADFNTELARYELKKPVQYWAKLGVRQTSGKRLPIPASQQTMNGAILLPQGVDGPAFLVYRNFDVIMEWNRSINYALSIGHLADRLNNQPALRIGRDADNRRMTREQFMEIQHLLISQGLDPGAIDGMPGTKTRLAIRAYQKASGLPVDGHASAGLLEYMQKARPSGV